MRNFRNKLYGRAGIQHTWFHIILSVWEFFWDLRSETVTNCYSSFFYIYISFLKRLDAQALSCRQHGFSSLNVVTSWPESLVDKLK